MDKSQKKKIYALCDPYKDFSDNKDILIDNIDSFEDNSESLIRGFNWSSKLFKKIDFGENDTLQLFTGFPGSGKSTILKKVKQQLEKEDYLVVYIDADKHIELTKEIEIADIYNAILYNVAIEVNKLFGNDNEDSFAKEGYFKRLNDFLSTEVGIKEFKIANIAFELKENPTLRNRVLEHINDNFSSFKKDIKLDLYSLNEKVKKQKSNGMVVIFDSLEKNQGITSNYEEVVRQCEVIFSNRDNLSMPFDIIYTVPPYLSERITTIDIDFLPSIKVKDKDNKKFDKGTDLLQTLILKRVDEESLREILGDKFEDKLEKIILFSGGYVREALHIMREVILQDNYPVKDTALNKILHNVTNKYQELINHETKISLEKVKKDKSISNIDNIELKDRLLSNHLILRYRNDDLWFDIHPAIEKLIESKTD